MVERRALLAAGLVLLTALTGCKVEGGGGGQARAEVPVRIKAKGWPKPLPGQPGSARPVTVVIPRVGVRAAVTGIDGGKDGKLDAPSLREPNLAGWDRTGPTPGEPGASVLVGHLDTRTGPAVFARLRELKAGDTVAVVRADDRVVVFRTVSSEEVGKTDFPVRKVFGSSARPAIRLVTCGGRYDHDRHSYEDNLIVYADYVASYRLADLTSRKPPASPPKA